VRSIIDTFGKKDCIRVRIGVGHPQPQKKNITGHVLGNFSQKEIKTLNPLIDTACDACLHILQHGVTSAMNLFNQN
jgi:PTH1 family peptidyl-tRNA hydrolase